jgi:hypothetical protein
LGALRVDGVRDICANKLSAIIERLEPTRRRIKGRFVREAAGRGLGLRAEVCGVESLTQNAPRPRW